MNRKITALFLLAAVIFSVFFCLEAPAFADNSTSVALNSSVSWVFDSSTHGNVTGATVASGSLPDGLSISYSGTDTSLTGTPTKEGSFTAGIQISTADAAAYITNITVNVNSGKPAITKHPTGETVNEGEKAIFIARADNCKSFVWRIVSSDTTNTIIAKDAAAAFKGLTVSGTDTDTLVLENIPASMNGWAVECMFTGNDGSLLFTNGAIIHVNSRTLTAPTILSQPQSASLKPGETVTLKVSANASAGCTLAFQWYSAAENQKDNVQTISGATASSYTPPQTEGKTYYCVDVYNVKDGVKSAAMRSSLVSVEYASAAEPTQTPAPTEAPAQTAAVSETPAAEADTSDISSKKDTGADSETESGSLVSAPWYIFVLIGSGVILICLIAAVIVVRNGKYDDEPEFVCPKCGWAPGEDDGTPYFCPSCGEPFSAEKWEK